MGCVCETACAVSSHRSTVALEARDPETRKRRDRVERLLGGSEDRRRVATR